MDDVASCQSVLDFLSHSQEPVSYMLQPVMPCELALKHQRFFARASRPAAYFGAPQKSHSASRRAMNTVGDMAAMTSLAASQSDTDSGADEELQSLQRRSQVVVRNGRSCGWRWWGPFGVTLSITLLVANQMAEHFMSKDETTNNMDKSQEFDAPASQRVPDYASEEDWSDTDHSDRSGLDLIGMNQMGHSQVPGGFLQGGGCPAVCGWYTGCKYHYAKTTLTMTTTCPQAAGLPPLPGYPMAHPPECYAVAPIPGHYPGYGDYTGKGLKSADRLLFGGGWGPAYGGWGRGWGRGWGNGWGNGMYGNGNMYGNGMGGWSNPAAMGPAAMKSPPKDGQGAPPGQGWGNGWAQNQPQAPQQSNNKPTPGQVWSNNGKGAWGNKPWAQGQPTAPPKDNKAPAQGWGNWGNNGNAWGQGKPFAMMAGNATGAPASGAGWGNYGNGWGNYGKGWYGRGWYGNRWGNYGGGWGGKWPAYGGGMGWSKPPAQNGLYGYEPQEPVQTTPAPAAISVPKPPAAKPAAGVPPAAMPAAAKPQAAKPPAPMAMTKPATLPSPPLASIPSAGLPSAAKKPAEPKHYAKYWSKYYKILYGGKWSQYYGGVKRGFNIWKMGSGHYRWLWGKLYGGLYGKKKVCQKFGYQGKDLSGMQGWYSKQYPGWDTTTMTTTKVVFVCTSIYCQIPLEFVNDTYCDCADCEDEAEYTCHTCPKTKTQTTTSLTSTSTSGTTTSVTTITTTTTSLSTTTLTTITATLTTVTFTTLPPPPAPAPFVPIGQGNDGAVIGAALGSTLGAALAVSLGVGIGLSTGLGLFFAIGNFRLAVPDAGSLVAATLNGTPDALVILILQLAQEQLRFIPTG